MLVVLVAVMLVVMLVMMAIGQFKFGPFPRRDFFSRLR